MRPAGLISWYGPDGSPLAAITSWVALIGGSCPTLRTAWYHRFDTETLCWPGGDFVLNLPHESDLEMIRKMMGQGRLSLHAKEELNYSCISGQAAAAPRFLECAVQIECVGGRFLETEFDIELCGDVARMHRDGINLNPHEIPDICAMLPLSP